MTWHCLFLFQVPGVSNVDFLRMAANAARKSKGQPEMEPIEFYSFVTPILQKLNMDPVKFLNRNVNEGFSGGEKKRNEILQVRKQAIESGRL